MSIVGRTYLERGRPVMVVTQWHGKGPRNVAIRREDGEVVVRPFRGLRKLATPVTTTTTGGQRP
jgi:hypothetical protein